MATAMLSKDQLTPTDEAILDMLVEGRVTAPFVAEELDKSLEYVRSRLVRLMEHNHVDRIHDGLYELVDDPREQEEGDG